MICAFDKEKLTGFLDGELEAAEKAEVERHIASCSECLRELGELKSTAQMVRELPRLRAPLSVAAGIARESRAADRARSFKRVRHTLLWVAGAAAALLVGVNVVYFRGLSSDTAAARGPSAANGLARAELRRAPADEPQPAAEPAKSAPLAAAAPQAPEPGARKSLGAQLPPADKARDEGALTRSNLEERGAHRARQESEALKGSGPAAPKPAAAPGAAASAPPPPAPPGALPEPVAKAAEKSVQAQPSRALVSGKDADAGQEAPKQKKSSPADAAAGSAATHLTLASTQLARSRGHLDEELRKLGVNLPGPAGGGRGQRAPTREDATLTVELTESQVARLRRELEKPGSCTVLAGRPEDTLVPGLFEPGGLFGAAKRVAAPSAAAPVPRKPQEAPRNDPKGDEPDRDAKQVEEQQAAPVPAAVSADRLAEAKHKVILHLVEVASLPEAVRPVDPANKK